MSPEQFDPIITVAVICFFWVCVCVILAMLESRKFWKRVKIDNEEKKP